MIELKQSTNVTLTIGPFLDATDGVTEETALGSLTVEVSKNGAAWGTRNDATATVHQSEGWYSCELNTTDTNTLGVLKLKCQTSATHLPVWHEMMVCDANWYDTKYGSDVLEADLTQMGGVTQSATDLKDFADAGYDPSTNKINGVVLVDTTTTNTDMVAAAPTANAIADQVWDETQSSHTTGGSFGQIATEIASILVDTGTTIPGTITTLDNNIDAILVDTAEIGAAGAGLTAVGNIVWTETISAEPTAVFAWSGSYADILEHIGADLRNKKTVTSTTLTVRNDADSGDLWTKTLSDSGGTFTATESA